MEKGERIMPEWLVKQFEARAEAERNGGGHVEIDDNVGYVAVTLSDGSEYFFQGDEADALLAEVPDDLSREDYILASAQSW
jgi:hypothetical protein